MQYEDMVFKIPMESDTYKEDSDFVIRQITNILDERKRAGDDKNNRPGFYVYYPVYKTSGIF